LQQYLFYSTETKEMIGTFLRSVRRSQRRRCSVQLSAEDWREAEVLDGGTGGMLVELDSSLLTIIELENDRVPPVDTEAC